MSTPWRPFASYNLIYMRRLITFLDNQMAICISWILKLGHLMNDRRQAYVYLLAASYL